MTNARHILNIEEGKTQSPSEVSWAFNAR